MARPIPWDELEPFEKDMFTQMLHDMGLDVSVEEASEYYGNKEKAEREAKAQ